MERRCVIENIQRNADQIRQRFKVKKLRVFGSTARGQSTDASDVDVLVEFEGPSRFDTFMDLKFFLEDLLGAKVDLVTRKAIRPSMRQAIEAEAVDVA